MRLFIENKSIVRAPLVFLIMFTGILLTNSKVFAMCQCCLPPVGGDTIILNSGDYEAGAFTPGDDVIINDVPHLMGMQSSDMCFCTDYEICTCCCGAPDQRVTFENYISETTCSLMMTLQVGPSQCDQIITCQNSTDFQDDCAGQVATWEYPFPCTGLSGCPQTP